jgi:glycine/D-amino acid oxidase-like deaminating enzyme
MTALATQSREAARGWYAAAATEWTRRPRLTFDLDVDVCVVGGGLAGLTVAREAARLGATVALLEARTVGWSASGYNLGAVTPGFGVDIEQIVSRIGLEGARELWELSQQGVDYVRAAASADGTPGIAITNGFLEVSSVDSGDRLVGRLQLLGEEFGSDVEGWLPERVREAIRTPHYFHGVHHPRSFHIHGLNYARALALQAERAGVRIFEDTIVVGIDPAGVRKRIVTAAARLRSSFIVLAGNVHLGPPFPRLNETLLPTWRYAAVTEPLGRGLDDALPFKGVVEDSTGLDQFKRIDGDRLMWSGPRTAWPIHPRWIAGVIRRRIAKVLPQLGDVRIADIISGVTGETVHGMPQIGQLRRGLWIASGFGGRGIGAAAMAGLLVAEGMLAGDERWRLFSPFELVWSGGVAGRFAAQVVYSWSRGAAATQATLSRFRERARYREQERERRAAAANQAVRAMRVTGQGTRPRPPAGLGVPRQEAAQETSRDRDELKE